MNKETVGARATAPSVDVLLERITALHDLIDRSAGADEEATQPSDEVLKALEQSGLFQIMAPKEFGGLEAHPCQTLDVLSSIAYADGATGWYCQAAVTGPAIAGGFLGSRAVKEIFAPGGRATASGMAAPIGKAERVGDGYRISGSFSFGTGTPTAAWIVGGYTLHENGKPVLRDNGFPMTLIVLAPRAKVDLLGGWNVLGCRATGSYDFRVNENIVHTDFGFDSAHPVAQRGGPLYRMGFLAIPFLCHASFAIGCAGRALDEWLAHAQKKKRMTTGMMAEMETFQRDFALTQARLRSAESYLREAYSTLYSAAEKGIVDEDLQIDARLAASNTITVAAEVTQVAFTSCATTGLRNGSVIQRCFRDAQAGNAHSITGEQNYISIGKFLAGMRGDGAGFL